MASEAYFVPPLHESFQKVIESATGVKYHTCLQEDVWVDLEKFTHEVYGYYKGDLHYPNVSEEFITRVIRHIFDNYLKLPVERITRYLAAFGDMKKFLPRVAQLYDATGSPMPWWRGCWIRPSGTDEARTLSLRFSSEHQQHLITIEQRVKDDHIPLMKCKLCFKEEKYVVKSLEVEQTPTFDLPMDFVLGEYTAKNLLSEEFIAQVEAHIKKAAEMIRDWECNAL